MVLHECKLLACENSKRVCAELPFPQQQLGKRVADFGLCHQLAVRHAIRRADWPLDRVAARIGIYAGRDGAFKTPTSFCLFLQCDEGSVAPRLNSTPALERVSSGCNICRGDVLKATMAALTGTLLIQKNCKQTTVSRIFFLKKNRAKMELYSVIN